MRFTFFFFLVAYGISFGQDSKWSPAEIRTKVSFIQNKSLFSDSLDYVDSTCTYLNKGLPYSGYVVHTFDDQFRFNLFEEGKYYGEEWIFDGRDEHWDSDSLVNNLKEFRIRCDTNEYFMIVTTYYNFQSNSIHEIFISRRFECALREPFISESFDVIFGGDDYHELPYRSFYENGNKKEVSWGHPYKDGQVVIYDENGKMKTFLKATKNGRNGKMKEFDEEGKCTKRLKFRNNKIRGFYIIMGGKFSLSCIARHQLKKQEKRKNKDD